MPAAVATPATAAQAEHAPASAQMNVRINAALKEQGDAVLARNGITPSQAVRSLWAYLATHDDLPEYLKEQQERPSDEERARRLAAVDRASGLAWKLAEESGLLPKGSAQRYRDWSGVEQNPAEYWQRVKEEAWDEKAEQYRATVEASHA